ncbi:hypothetical protein ACH4TX_05470 [Streptomyces sp. NPDC021098]|uniref:hypothetical protein n=1 Tax=unclassified Streptomyces TaxID=2593676 RepID=UPI0037985AF8
MTENLNSLALYVLVPEPDEEGAVAQLRPVVDGRDVVAEAFGRGPSADPLRALRVGSPLRAVAGTREMRWAEARCTEGCCGALYVTVRRDGDHVVWGGWRDSYGGDVALGEFRFDAHAYDAEVERVATGDGWEWPGHAVARLLDSEFRRHPEWLARWQCQFDAVCSWPWDRERIRFSFFHPEFPPAEDGAPWLQFMVVEPVTGDAPEEQVRAFMERVAGEDPRDTATVCGGSRESAERLGYPWPQRRKRSRTTST